MTLNHVRGQYAFAMLPERMITDDRVSDRAVRLWALLSRVTWDGENTFPSRAALARLLRCSTDSVDRAINELVQAGWLEKHLREAGSINDYVLDPDPPDAPPPHGSDTPSAQERNPFRTGADHSLLYRDLERSIRSRASRRERQGIPARPPEENLPDEDAKMHPGRGGKSSPSSPSSPTPRAGSGRGLAQHFRRTAEQTWTRPQLGPDPFNDRALASKLAQWKREGVTEDQIRAMIDLFCTEPLPDGKPPWVSFLAARARLAKRVTRSQIDLDQYRIE